MSATVNPLVTRRPCPSCRVEVLSVDVDWAEVFLDVGEADSPVAGDAVLLAADDKARHLDAWSERRKGEALHRVHVCALAEVAA